MPRNRNTITEGYSTGGSSPAALPTSGRVLVLVLAGVLAACAPVQFSKVDQQLVAEPDPIGLRLAGAADRAAAALQTLAAVEQARTPGIDIQSVPAAPAELRRTVSVEWVGPVEPLARSLADRAGYRFRTLGEAPPMPIVANVRARQVSVVEVLRDLGLQMGQRAHLVVDVDQRIVEIKYAPVSDG